MKAGGPVNPVSERRADENEVYRQLRYQLLPGPCEVCGPFLAAAAKLLADGVIDKPVLLQCGKTATELHHRRKRSSSGALTNRRNVRRSCHDGNMAIEDHPLVAEAAGLTIRPGHPEWDALSSRVWRDTLRALDPPDTQEVHQRKPPTECTVPDPF